MLTIDYMRRSVSRRLASRRSWGEVYLCPRMIPANAKAFWFAKQTKRANALRLKAVSLERRSARTCCGQPKKRSPTGQSAALRLVTRMRHAQLNFALLNVD